MSQTGTAVLTIRQITSVVGPERQTLHSTLVFLPPIPFDSSTVVVQPHIDFSPQLCSPFIIVTLSLPSDAHRKYFNQTHDDQRRNDR